MEYGRFQLLEECRPTCGKALKCTAAKSSGNVEIGATPSGLGETTGLKIARY